MHLGVESFPITVYSWNFVTHHKSDNGCPCHIIHLHDLVCSVIIINVYLFKEISKMCVNGFLAKEGKVYFPMQKLLKSL